MRDCVWAGWCGLGLVSMPGRGVDLSETLLAGFSILLQARINICSPPSMIHPCPHFKGVLEKMSDASDVEGEEGEAKVEEVVSRSLSHTHTHTLLPTKPLLPPIHAPWRPDVGP